METFSCYKRCYIAIVLIENISSVPIKVGKFFLRKQINDRLTERKENSINLSKKSISKESLFPIEILAPGEKIIVPLEIFFRYHPETKEFIENTLIKYAFPKDVDELNKVKMVSIIHEENGGLSSTSKMKSISLSKLTKFINKPKQDPEINKEFTFGTSVSIEEVEIDGLNYPVRKYDEGKFILYNNSAQGSCPYATPIRQK